MSNALLRLRESSHNFSSTEKEIARIVLDNPQLVVDMSVHALAKHTFSSASTHSWPQGAVPALPAGSASPGLGGRQWGLFCVPGWLFTEAPREGLLARLPPSEAPPAQVLLHFPGTTWTSALGPLLQPLFYL